MVVEAPTKSNVFHFTMLLHLYVYVYLHVRCYCLGGGGTCRMQHYTHMSMQMLPGMITDPKSSDDGVMVAVEAPAECIIFHARLLCLCVSCYNV